MFVRFEIKNKLSLAAIKDCNTGIVFRHIALYRRSNIPRSASITRSVNRCMSTGRKYSTVKRFQMSRFAIRFHANEGYLPGVRRHSW